MVEQVFNKTVDLMFEGLLTTGLSIKYDLHFFYFALNLLRLAYLV